MRNTSKTLLLLISFFTLAVSCKDKEEDDTPVFEKKEIMQQLADAWILPAYQEFQEKFALLESEWSAYKANPDILGLEVVKTAWKECYLSFQNVKMIDFGPAADNGFVAATGTFPCDTFQIENNIASGSYNLSTLNNISSIGLPVFDYLLYKTDAMMELSSQPNRQKYVDDVLLKIKTETNAVIAGWATYKSTFVEGTGNSSTSPFSLLVNAFCKDFELAKNAKVGIPIGTQSLGIQRPEYLEARKSGLSTKLLQKSFTALHSVFLGNGLDGQSGKGFDDYLLALEKTSLSQTIQDRFTYLIANPDSWNGTMENMMQTDVSTLTVYHDYIKGSVVYIKSDMASAFGILITYQDNDGD